DGLRVDAVSNILYLYYDRVDGLWIPNIYGGHEKLEGIAFLKELNGVLKHTCKGVINIDEESSSWPEISTPVETGGLGVE
ncbi:1,4-alpha-glucan branching enzyme, partial [Francisella tularensis subsp. holarctica]|nr:1,4-alpha-glucan branching enzyme [Francisella tularensis subsp. holarctica]